MTAKHVVADDTLGKIARKVWELNRRILEGSILPERTLAMLQWIIEGVPRPKISKEYSGGTYLLESNWAFDHSHREFATFTLEEGTQPAPEKILDPSLPEWERKWLLKTLKKIFDAQVPKHGSYRMTRLYRVLDRNFFGYQPGIEHHSQKATMDGRLEQEVVDFHLILQPICDFDDDGNPIPCVCDIGPNGEPIYLKDRVKKTN
jgi:hypothetical protein